jgi:hypothetical protein
VKERERERQQFGMVGCTKMVSKLAWDMKEEYLKFEMVMSTRRVSN